MILENPGKVKLPRILVIVAVVWTGILYALYLWAARTEKTHLDRLIALRAESVANHTQAVRSWIGGHGGVYVELAEGEGSSPLAGILPESEVITPSGRKLSLLSSSIVVGKISKGFMNESGDRIRLTSKTPMNPANTPVEWERLALDALERGAEKFETFVSDGQHVRFCLMYPMVLQERCLRCHDYLANTATKIVGGLSVTVDRAPYDKQYDEVLSQLSMGYLGIWFVGMAGIGTFGAIGSRLLKRIEYASTHDGLTGLLNRREIERLLALECGRAQRYNHPLTVMMLDLDHFKRINDTHGHQGGDEALRVVAETIRGTIRGTDMVGRYGGEEFLVIAPETSAEAAVELADRLNLSVKGASIRMPGNRTLSVTISIGVSSLPPGVLSPHVLVQSADRALYRAKEEGRDRVVVVDTA